MTSKKPFIIGSILFIILFAVSFVTASIDVNTYTPSKDFLVTSAYSEVSICSCSSKYDTFTVTNTGTWPAIFTVSANEVKSKLTFSQSAFELAPGQSTEVFMYITADCSKGSDLVEITVTSNLGPQKTFNKKIVRDRCQNIELWVSNYTNEIKPCQSKSFDVNIHNVGPFSESYTIESNYDNYITYNAKSFNLDQNQFVKVTATAKFGCEVYGQKDIIFTVRSAKNKLTASINAPLNIIQDYDYTLLVNYNGNESLSLPVCNRMQSTKIPIIIKNTGSVKNTYEVKFDNVPKNAKVVELSGKFTLNTGEIKTFYIDIDSTNYRYEEKTKELSVKVIPEYGDIIKESEVALNFMPCYEHELIVYDYGNSEKKPLRTCAEYDYGYNINLINSGAFKETFTLSLEDAPSTVKLSKTKTTLSAGDNEIIQLLITGPEENKDYNIRIKVTSGIGISEYANVWITSYDAQSCHNTIFKKDSYKINYQTEYINVPIKNKGMVENAYIVLWDGSNIVDFNSNTISINKSSSKNVQFKLRSAGKNESTYTGQIIAYDASGAIYSQDVSIQLKDKNLVRKTFEYLAYGTVCRQVSLYQLVAIVLIILLTIFFLIRGPHYPYNFWNRVKSKTSVIVLLTVIFFVALIIVIAAVGLPKTHTEVYNLTNNDTELTYEWLQNDKYTLDVSKFFYDPENSTLNYNVSGIENIKAVVKDKSITFYSDLGWSGTEYARITAYDSMGGKVVSPKFTLIVRNVPKKSIVELYNIYCWYTNLAIFAVVLLFVFVAVFVKQHRRTRK